LFKEVAAIEFAAAAGQLMKRGAWILKIAMSVILRWPSHVYSRVNNWLLSVIFVVERKITGKTEVNSWSFGTQKQ
jgi:hypothetical protein